MLDVKELMGMVGRSLRSPREGASEVLSLGIPREAVGLIVVLVAVLSVLLAQLMGLLFVPREGEVVIGLFDNAFIAGIVHFAAMLLLIGATYWIGRAMGGTGSASESALIIAWLQFIMVCVQLVQLAVLIILPPLAGIVGIVALGLFLWLLTNFIATLHGFKSLGQVFGMILISAFVLAFVVNVLMVILGVEIQIPESGA